MMEYNPSSYRRCMKATYSNSNQKWFSTTYWTKAIKPMFTEAEVINCWYQDVQFKNGGHRMACNLDLGLMIEGNPYRVTVRMFDTDTSKPVGERDWKSQKEKSLHDFEYFAYLHAGERMAEQTLVQGNKGQEVHFVNLTGMKVYVIIGTVGGTDQYPNNRVWFFDSEKHSAMGLANLDDEERLDFMYAMKNCQEKYNKYISVYPPFEEVSQATEVEPFGTSELADSIPF